MKQTVNQPEEQIQDRVGYEKQSSSSARPLTRNRELSSDSANQANPNLLTRYFTQERRHSSQKTTALAVPQNVNAHAFLPPFDGAGEAPDEGETGPVPGSSQSNTGQESEQGKDAWYKPKERTRPSPAVLRDFFRRIEEQERSMIQSYQMADPWHTG